MLQQTHVCTSQVYIRLIVKISVPQIRTVEPTYEATFKGNILNLQSFLD